MTKRKTLIKALKLMSAKALDDIEKSINGSDPILIDSWFAQGGEGQWYGCLMMDGHAQVYRAERRKFEAGVTAPKRAAPALFLEGLYEMKHMNYEVMDDMTGEIVSVIENAAYSFDRWAKGSYRSSTGFDAILSAEILTASGRRAMKKILAEARA